MKRDAGSSRRRTGARPRGKGSSGAGQQDFFIEDVIDRPFDRGLAGRLFGHVRPYRRLLVLSVVLIVLGTVFQLAGPMLVKEALDGPIAGSAGAGPASEGTAFHAWLSRTFSTSRVDAAPTDAGARLRFLGIIVMVYGVLLVLGFLARYAQSIVMNRTGQSVMRDLRLRVFEKLQRQSQSFFQRQPVGRLVTRVTSDVEALNELFTSGLVTFLGDLLTVLGIVVLMFYYNPSLALLALAVSPVLVGMTLLFRVRARKHYREIRRTLAHLSAYTQESISGIEIIQVSRREDSRAEGYRRINDGYVDAYMKSIFWYAVFYPSVELFSAISLALVLAASGQQIVAGTMTFGEFFLFWIYLNRFFVPIRDLAEKYNLLLAAMAASERIFRILDHDESIPEAASPRAREPLRHGIRFENVSFAYDAGLPVLKTVSFEVARGETVAIVGATGAGKSTVVQLLLRFHDPTTGRILLDGVDLREYALADHRRRFGLVLQDTAIFSRDVAANIDLDRGLPAARVREAAAEIGAAAVVERLAHGYGEVMKERGRTLSSGERQLLAFARALAGDPEVLVLDEATSHLDADAEALIQRAMQRLTHGRTSVIVAHRLSTVRDADRILVFHHGELREEGTHEALIARGGIYARLCQLQFR